MSSASPNADRQSHRGWNQWGLTLAEVLVALSIITVGLMAMAVGLQQATAFVEMGRQQTIAVFLAQQRLEQVKASALWDFDGVASTKFPAETPRQRLSRVSTDGRDLASSGGPRECRARPGHRDLPPGHDPLDGSVRADGHARHRHVAPALSSNGTAAIAWKKAWRSERGVALISALGALLLLTPLVLALLSMSTFELLDLPESRGGHAGALRRRGGDRVGVQSAGEHARLERPPRSRGHDRDRATLRRRWSSRAISCPGPE